MSFPNRLGIAGGLDKEAKHLAAWWAFGAGFIEVGTVTPRAQRANPGMIIDRDVKSRALWNKMGFPGPGARAVRDQLERYGKTRPTPVFVNIGKNRNTDLEAAHLDYLSCAETLREQADAFVVNVSSPNTQGLRQLQEKDSLSKLVADVVRVGSRPVLVKLSPDMNEKDLENSLHAGIEGGAKGFILTNTTLTRPQFSSWPNEGGVSGAPLAARSRQSLINCQKLLGSERERFLVVSVGGVMSPQDVADRLELGADLVQVYTALVFHGPGFFRTTARKMHHGQS